MSFWQSHEEAKKALFHWWAFGDHEAQEKIGKLSDREAHELLPRRKCILVDCASTLFQYRIDGFSTLGG